MSETDYEVVLVGAGPVGLLVTLFLAKAGIKTALLDSLPSVDNSPRAMAYGAPAIIDLERAGVAEDARKFGMEPSDFDFRLRWITIDNKVIAQFQPEDAIPGALDPVICGQYRLAQIIQSHIAKYDCAKVRLIQTFAQGLGDILFNASSSRYSSTTNSQTSKKIKSL